MAVSSKKEETSVAIVGDSRVEVSLDAVKKIQKSITRKHKRVSRIETPKAFVKKKQGFDYTEYSYMRDVADKEYPGWSWTIINTQFVGDTAFLVQGRLKWFDEGIWREGDVTAAHRIQKLTSSNEYSDVGNDVKAANTDAIKKAMNMYMNIADDVYKNIVEDMELADDQVEEMVRLAGTISDDYKVKVGRSIQEGNVNALNYKGSLAKLRRIADAQS
tara:strand:- start:1259 stop:1909 length:651 start_codon:yes stop_codon:yes gene_type:complete